MSGLRWSPERYAEWLSRAGRAGAEAKQQAEATAKKVRGRPRVGREKLEGEELFLHQVKLCGLPIPEREFRFHSERKFRSDFAWPGRKLLVEIEGAIFTNGRHTRGVGYRDDCRKYNFALLLGYRVLRFTPCMVESGEALQITEQALRL